MANPFGEIIMYIGDEEAFTRVRVYVYMCVCVCVCVRVCVCVCVKAPLGACDVGSSRNKRGWGGCDPSPSVPQQEVMKRGGGSHY